MDTEPVVPVHHEADILAARTRARAIAASLGFDESEQILIATAISEIARNMLEYANGGVVQLRTVSSGNRNGIEVTAKDEGPGIPDVALALQDGWSTGKSLGLGLPGARRLMDEFEIQSRVGAGTTVVMRKWVT